VLYVPPRRNGSAGRGEPSAPPRLCFGSENAEIVVLDCIGRFYFSSPPGTFRGKRGDEVGEADGWAGQG